ncbi:hypothetical protein GCM10027168_35500 [Streptomyces capparidis]
MTHERQRFGQYLARLRLDARISQRDLADHLCRLSGTQSLTRHEVSRWERGARTPDTWLPFLAQALGVPLEELRRAAFPARRGTRPVPVRAARHGRGLADLMPGGAPLTRRTARTGRRVGQDAVDHVLRRAHRLRLADDVLAGGDLLHPALRELDSATRLYRDAAFTEETGRRLLAAIGELAQIAGWIAADAGELARAERIHRLGLTAARTARDHTLAANILGSLAYQVTNTGDPAEGVAMARAAVDLAGDEAPPRARALYWDRLAWAHVRAGQTQPALHALARAAEAYAQAGPGDEDPPYLYWVDREEIQIMEARAYTELRRPLRAVPVLTDVLGRYDATHARELALYLSWLAVAYADGNEPEEAARTAARMLTLSTDMASERTAERSRVVLRHLRTFAKVPAVRALLAEHPVP